MLLKEGDIIPPSSQRAVGQNRIRCLQNERPETYRSGVYSLEWWVNGKRRRLFVGRNSDTADEYGVFIWCAILFSEWEQGAICLQP